MSTDSTGKTAAESTAASSPESTPELAPQQAPAPALRVVAGQPTAEELAALVVVLASRASASAGTGTGADGAEASHVVSAWTDRSRYVRPVRVGFGARAGWRASALPY